MSRKVEEQQVRALKGKIKAAKSSMTRINRFLSEHETDEYSEKLIDQLSTRKEALADVYKQFQQSQLELLSVDENEEDQFESIENLYFETLSQINRLIFKLTDQNQAKSRNISDVNNQSNIPIVKLPDINIPFFDGNNLNEYQPFVDMFKAVIHKNTQMHDVEKLFHLRSHLKGEALFLISNLPLKNESYQLALNLLKEQYEDEAMLINAHINAILDIPSFSKCSSNNLKEFVAKVKQHTGALENLKQPVTSWDMILLCILCKKIDFHTNQAYHNARDKTKLPTLKEFLNFLQTKVKSMQSITPLENKPGGSKHFVHLQTTNSVGLKTKKCIFCSFGEHRLFECKKFRNVPVSHRISFIDKNKFCRICLNQHFGYCKSHFKCQICQKGHNTLLHLEKSQGEHSDQPTSNSAAQLLFGRCPKSPSDVLLPTVMVRLIGKSGNTILACGLLDSGSQISLITNKITNYLQLEKFNTFQSISGISEIEINANMSVNVEVQSLFNKFTLSVKCFVVEHITSFLPTNCIDIADLKIPPNIQLSNENFHIPTEIDILFNADIFFKVILCQKMNINSFILQNTKFGYIVSGFGPSNKSQICTVVSMHSAVKLEKLISQFWETEKVPQTFIEYSSEQAACEDIFKSNLSIVNGRFQVSLPLKCSLDELNLGDSYSVAYRRLMNLEKRFKSNSDLFLKYNNFIDEYIQLGHAKVFELSDYNFKVDQVYFMAHHPVIREDKVTTKLRVVFDGSMKTYDNKKSINDLLYNGAVVQNELFDILILFRTYQFVLLTDIKKMYRMILVSPQHRCLQNILWRSDPSLPVQGLQLQTVTYGLKSSAFLATRCLVELANENRIDFPLASKALLTNTYVDDILSGGNSIEETIKLKNELIQLLKSRGFELHKWSSNNDMILNNIPFSQKQVEEIKLDKNNAFVKTLGLSYNTATDSFKISAPVINYKDCISKRQVLSFISKFYDPLGFVGPVIVKAKIFMQSLWLLKIGWDEILPDKELRLWYDFASKLIQMEPIIIPRNFSFATSKRIELIGYCDSSFIAYGAVLYTRVLCNDQVHVNLICSKSRIAPIAKELSIPRLELNAALLLSKLVEKVFGILKENTNEVYLYSDSTIVLSWLKVQPIKLNPYVANRVLKIQESTTKFNWLYIDSKSNPADCLSRGLDPQLLNDNNLWFFGPEELKSIDYVHKETMFVLSSPLPEQKVQHFSLVIEPKNSFFERYSNLSHLQRIMAYILRFYHNCKNINNRISGYLKIQEIENALKIIIKFEQNFSFKEEIRRLVHKEPIKSNLCSLNPFLDGEGLLRVGGRLQNANVTYSQKHPIILPKNNHVTDLIIVHEHLRLLHAGQKQVLSSLNMSYWILSGTREVKKNLHKCITCFKQKAQCAQQLMGSLPEKRVTASRPFSHVGIDFCGPFYIKQSRIRKTIITKAYVSLFVCFAVKAIHIELLSDMTTECFLAALKRFIARRGKPSHIYCDNGATFKGADNVLRELYNKTDKEKIFNFCLDERIKFSFIPSYSPVFGGLWEAGVKSTKYHIKRVVGVSNLTYEEFNTVLIQIESILNSRPITPMSNDPSDLSYLTPGHFLTGAPISCFPESDLTEIPENRLKHWQLITRMQQQFWKRWYKDYLAQLQNRPKWRQDYPNLKEGALVLLKEDNLPSFKWRLARITKIIPGKDNKVRVVEVKTTSGTYLRSVTKIAVLPISES